MGSSIRTALPLLCAGTLTALAAGCATRHTGQGWEALADRLALTFRPGSFWHPVQLAGTYRGRPLNLDVFRQSNLAGETSSLISRLVFGLVLRRFATVMRVWLTVQNPALIYFTLEEQLEMLEKVMRLLDWRHPDPPDLHVGDAAFDRRFLIAVLPEAYTNRLWGPDLRRRLLQARWPVSLELNNQRLQLAHVGPVDYDYFPALCDLASDVADVVEAVSRAEVLP